jgi:nitroreductase
MDALEALTTRVSIAALSEPAPDDATLATLFKAATRAPDHGRLKPWRFVIIRGHAREKLGAVLADAAHRREPSAPPEVIAREHAKPLRAPLIVIVAAKLMQSRKVPAMEQVVAAGAAAQNLLLAAHALGFGGMWKTGEPAYDDTVKHALGFGPEDMIVGFLYLGTPTEHPTVPEPGDLTHFVREWTGPV